MVTEKKIRGMRVVEWFSIVLLVGGIIGLYRAVEQNMDILILAGLSGGLVVILLVLVFVQRRFDQWLSAVSFQNQVVANEEFHSLFESSPVAYITVNSAGKMVDYNPAAVNILHGTADTMYESDFFSLVHPDFDFSVLQGKIKAGATVNEEEVQLRSYTGDTVWVSMSIHKRRQNDERMISLVDITEKKAVDTAKSEFVALATHQLRTPIAAIRWNAELLRKNMTASITPDQDRYMTKVERNVQRMVHLINDFLSVSKLEMGTFASSEEAVNLTEFFDSIVDEFQEKLTEKNIQLNRTDTPPNVQIMTDSRLFHIIVSNLVSNAVKYVNPSGNLTFTYVLEGTNLKIDVADDGIGVPEEEVERLFSKFFRATNAQAHQTQGTGLGLYVVKQSVEQLGGTISVVSRENEGAHFTVKLPVTVLSAGA
jgi:two-component system phosphate regulon sensor histidine kinase PhoR